ncbi:hydroxymethylglutaryl-CoA lyase [Fredinandcohnia quinoae]|uniref:Hydroxymethylglutaryl-CoA lyase n=1 Tax=Fredinandcohnia quinoae TaxID=2918902 RepID=A0AAW5DZT7_9BACI|nr:hydroxymethylglutaryl-CoA lyase [Fredinandcohnia sp. SECRCQ15]MCH1624839.1 hydroxymethylglutaryl-CoA lyase [Fredinandcohnia sp. SECRCQ15]
MQLPKQVTIIEVGPRDGLQNEKNIISTEDKISFIQKLKQSGIREMELTSFVSPKWVPQMKDATEVIHACLDDTRNFVLAPNRKGIDRLNETNCKAVAVFVGVSESFNKKNINKSTRESMEELRPIIKELKEKGYFVRACISTSFYCPYEGKMNEQSVIDLCSEFVHYGVDELSVADTIGKANPKEVYSLFSKLKDELPNTLLTGHFHDTRGMAIANVFAAIQVGISRFDTSAGGLGGCPFAPGATGNVATEDVVYMLEQMGIETGINLQKLVEAIDIIRPLLSRPLESKFYKLQNL